MPLLRDINATVAGIEQDANIRNVFMTEFLAACPILQYLLFYTFTGSSDEPEKGATATGGNVRSLNNNWTASATNPVLGSVSLRIFGDAIKTDTEYLARGNDIGDEHLRQLRNFAKSMGRDFQDRFVNDTTSSTTWNGLRALTPTVANVTEFELGTGNGLVVANGNSDTARQAQQQLIEKLIIVSRGATFILMDDLTRARLGSVAQGMVHTTTITDALGNPMELATFNGKPIVISGENKDQSAAVLQFNRTVGSSSNCGEIYAVTCGEKTELTMGTNASGVRVEGPQRNGNFLETQVNFSCGMERLSARAIKRITGLKLV